MFPSGGPNGPPLGRCGTECRSHHASGNGQRSRLGGSAKLEPRYVNGDGALDACDCDREILDSEPGRVEDRDLVGSPPPKGLAGEYSPELDDIVADDLT